jgi:hypothetical protein
MLRTCALCCFTLLSCAPGGKVPPRGAGGGAGGGDGAGPVSGALGPRPGSTSSRIAPYGLPAVAATAQNSLDTTDPNVVFPTLAALVPDGTLEADSIPDTLDLAEVAQRYLDGITSTLLPESPDFHAPPGMVDLEQTPTSFLHGGPPNWGKTIQAMAMARKMSGYDLDDAHGTLTAQLMSTRNMIDPNVGLNLINRGEGAWIVITGALPENQMTVAVEGLMELFKQYPSPDLQHLIQQMIDYHTLKATPYSENGIAMLHYRLPEPGVDPFTPSPIGTIGRGDSPFVCGKTMRALSTWFLMSRDTQALDTSTLLGNYVLHYSNDVFWTVPPGFPEGEGTGHFAGHMHMYANALMGMLWEADARRQVDPADAAAASLIQLVLTSYQFMRNLHGGASVALGNHGEVCTTGDLLRLAVKLTELGAADLNEDIDRWTRNQIAESQIVSAITIVSNPGDPLTDNIGQKVHGLFFEDATHPLAIPDLPNDQGSLTLQLVACGLGNPMHGIYDVWKHIVQFNGNVAQVNLLLNRATPALDVKSELPYRGVVHVVTRADLGGVDTLELRVPDGTDSTRVQVLVNGMPAPFTWVRTDFIHVAGLLPGTTYTVQFPLVTKQLGFAQVRNQDQDWAESDFAPASGSSVDYGFHESSAENMYVGTFRANTLVQVDHRPASGIALYAEPDRAHWATLGAGDDPQPTPYHTVTRFRLKSGL